jgi:predicted  nucleic acid-binding Zn-ribbon protein
VQADNAKYARVARAYEPEATDARERSQAEVIADAIASAERTLAEAERARMTLDNVARKYRHALADVRAIDAQAKRAERLLRSLTNVCARDVLRGLPDTRDY